MNKNVKKPSNNTYPQEKGRRLEAKMREKKEIIRTNRMYNKVMKEMDIDELEDLESLEYELFEPRNRKK